MRCFYKTTFLTIAGVILYAAFTYAIEIEKGDILTFIETREGSDVYILRKGEQYGPDYLFSCPFDLEPIYDMDHFRNRLYFKSQYNGVTYYVDLDTPPYSPEVVDFLPEDMHFACAARDGSSLILYKLTGDDIFAEENPVYSRPRKAWGEKPAMLFKYDIPSGELSRLTYSYTQWTAWVSPDGHLLAYRRFAPRSGNCEDVPYAWREGHIILCKMDGTMKFDLSDYFKNYKAGLKWVLADPGAEAFVPQPIKAAGYDAAYLVYLVPPAWAEKEFFSDAFEYYTATIYLRDGNIDCQIEKKNPAVPERFIFHGPNAYYSNDEEVYITADDSAGVRWLFLYNISKGESKKIPGTEGILHFIVY